MADIPSPTRVALVVTVNLDRSGFGTFSTPESAQETVEAILLSSIGHYAPVVMPYTTTGPEA